MESASNEASARCTNSLGESKAAFAALRIMFLNLLFDAA
jgi:hypothetical protein